MGLMDVLTYNLEWNQQYGPLFGVCDGMWVCLKTTYRIY